MRFAGQTARYFLQSGVDIIADTILSESHSTAGSEARDVGQTNEDVTFGTSKKSGAICKEWLDMADMAADLGTTLTKGEASTNRATSDIRETRMPTVRVRPILAKCISILLGPDPVAEASTKTAEQNSSKFVGAVRYFGSNRMT